MTIFSQKDIRWRFKQLGFCNTTIGSNGCAITCLGMLCGKRPDEVNQILRNNGGFVNGCLVWWQKACNLLGLKFYGISNKATRFPTIARVRMSRGEMHFVIVLSNNKIVDPLDGKEKINPYPIVEYVNVLNENVKTEQKPVQNTNPYPRKMVVVVPTLFVRKGPARIYPLAGSKILKKGDVFVAVGERSGERVNGIDKWYISQYGNYVWSGGCKPI